MRESSESAFALAFLALALSHLNTSRIVSAVWVVVAIVWFVLGLMRQWHEQ